MENLVERVLRLLTVTAASCLSVFAQDISEFEAYGQSSDMQFNPTLTGLQSQAFNGGAVGSGQHG
jgi:hypothetical protein